MKEVQQEVRNSGAGFSVRAFFRGSRLVMHTLEERYNDRAREQDNDTSIPLYAPRQHLTLLLTDCEYISEIIFLSNPRGKLFTCVSRHCAYGNHGSTR
jgi:hypothetical protein